MGSAWIGATHGMIPDSGAPYRARTHSSPPVTLLLLSKTLDRGVCVVLSIDVLQRATTAVGELLGLRDAEW